MKVCGAGSQTYSPLSVAFRELYPLPGLLLVHRLSTVSTMSGALAGHHVVSAHNFSTAFVSQKDWPVSCYHY